MFSSIFSRYMYRMDIQYGIYVHTYIYIYVCTYVYTHMHIYNPLILLIKVPLIIKPPGPNPKFSEYIYLKGANTYCN